MPIREAIAQLFVKELEEFKIRELSNEELKGQILYMGELKVKSDGAFEVQTRGKTVYIFYELKGYGDNSNDILSAITAAQLVKEMPKFKNSSLYYYIGVNSNREKSGFTRKSLGKAIEPYIKWAESKEFLWFYGIVEIGEILTDIRKRLESG